MPNENKVPIVFQQEYRFPVSNLAAAEALRVLLKYEKIEFDVGIGDLGQVFCFESNDREKVIKAIRQWKEAINYLPSPF